MSQLLFLYLKISPIRKLTCFLQISRLVQSTGVTPSSVNLGRVRQYSDQNFVSPEIGNLVCSTTETEKTGDSRDQLLGFQYNKRQVEHSSTIVQLEGGFKTSPPLHIAVSPAQLFETRCPVTEFPVFVISFIKCKQFQQK